MFLNSLPNTGNRLIGRYEEVVFSETFKCVLFSRFDMNLIQFTGPFDNEGLGWMKVS